MTREEIKSDSDYVIIANRFLGNRVVSGFDEDAPESIANVDRVIDEQFSGDPDAFLRAADEFGS